MIAQLKGRLEEVRADHLILDVHGVGFALSIPLGTFYALSGRRGEVVRLEVHTHVREDALQLFGFWTREERDLFRILLSISGVGPRMALAVLSGIGPEELVETIQAGDRDRLVRIPGVGRKTAERILLEAKDKLGLRAAPEREDRRGAAVVGAPPGGAAEDVPGQALSALLNLGFSTSTAEKAVREAVRDLGEKAVELEALLRACLKRLVRPARSRAGKDGHGILAP